MARSSRQSKILELISKKEIETQEELVDELRAAKFEVTQATISRDIKELGLIKVMADSKKYKYALEKSTNFNVNLKMTNMFRESVISIMTSGNLIIVKTLTGSAGSAANLIDKQGFDCVLGCIAGDDTVFVALDSPSSADFVIKGLESIIN